MRGGGRRPGPLHLRPIPARNLVNLNSVSKGYAGLDVLHDLTLGVNEGERIGIVGANGAGKSTLLRMIVGVEPPDPSERVNVYLPKSLIGRADRRFQHAIDNGAANYEYSSPCVRSSCACDLHPSLSAHRPSPGLADSHIVDSA